MPSSFEAGGRLRPPHLAEIHLGFAPPLAGVACPASVWFADRGRNRHRALALLQPLLATALLRPLATTSGLRRDRTTARGTVPVRAARPDPPEVPRAVQEAPANNHRSSSSRVAGLAPPPQPNAAYPACAPQWGHLDLSPDPPRTIWARRLRRRTMGAAQAARYRLARPRQTHRRSIRPAFSRRCRRCRRPRQCEHSTTRFQETNSCAVLAEFLDHEGFVELIRAPIADDGGLPHEKHARYIRLYDDGAELPRGID